MRKWTASGSTTFPVLIPMFDLANHNPSAAVGWEWNISSCNLVADQAVVGGAQVFNNYGFKGNEERGFVSGRQSKGFKADIFSQSLWATALASLIIKLMHSLWPLLQRILGIPNLSHKSSTSDPSPARLFPPSIPLF